METWNIEYIWVIFIFINNRNIFQWKLFVMITTDIYALFDDKIFFLIFFRARSERSWLDKWSYTYIWIQFQNPYDLGIQIRHPSIRVPGIGPTNGLILSGIYKKFWSRNLKSFTWKALGKIFKFPQNFNVYMNFWKAVFIYFYERWKNFSITFHTQFLQIGVVQISIL